MTFIFIGRSGSGKGTQAALLIDYLERNNQGKVFYVETGRYVRELITRDNYSGTLAKAISERGEKHPSFLAIYLWSQLLVNELKGGEQLVFDGTPRSLVEAEALGTALTFYQSEKPQVIFLDVHDDCARGRLMARGRHDDRDEVIKQRLAWYERDVAPVVEYYRTNPNYNLVTIDGLRSIEIIHEEIKKCCV